MSRVSFVSAQHLGQTTRGINDVGLSLYTVFRKKVIYLFLPYISHSFWANFTKLSVNILK